MSLSPTDAGYITTSFTNTNQCHQWCWVSLQPHLLILTNCNQYWYLGSLQPHLLYTNQVLTTWCKDLLLLVKLILTGTSAVTSVTELLIFTVGVMVLLHQLVGDGSSLTNVSSSIGISICRNKCWNSSYYALTSLVLD